jgi:hypothetical protein
MVDKWIEMLEESAWIQEHRIGLKSRHKGTASGSFIAQVEPEHPTYRISLYRYATNIFYIFFIFGWGLVASKF